MWARPAEEAQLLITEAGFTLGEATPEFSKEVEAGLIMDQSPVAGAPAEEGSAISFTVSKGPRQVEVPKIVGLTEDEAIAALEDAGFVSRSLPDQPSSKVPIGSVMKQTPAAGEMVDEGSQVEYVVSRGVETVAVPDVVGKKRSTAESTLDDAGFKVSRSEQFSDTVEAGIVISQNPSKGLEVAKGSTVRIVVSKGPERVKVPAVIGQSEADARATIENAGLKIEGHLRSADQQRHRVRAGAQRRHSGQARFDRRGQGRRRAVGWRRKTRRVERGRGRPAADGPFR